MTLFHDTCRCLGEPPGITACPRRETCARYTLRNTGGPRTPFAACLCTVDFKSYIPVKTETEPK